MLQIHDQAVVIDDAISVLHVDSMLQYVRSTEQYKEAESKVHSEESYYKFIPLSFNSIPDNSLGDHIAEAVRESHGALYRALEKTSLPVLAEEHCGISVCANFSMGYHADAERPYCKSDRDLGSPVENGNEGFKNPSKNEWQPNHTPNRVYTSLVYLTEDFEGGETTLPLRNMDVKPKTRRLFGFPCSRDYIHGVRRNTGGLRIAFTAWYKLAEKYSNVKDPYGFKDLTCLPTNLDH
jgi:hypothetical protein